MFIETSKGIVNLTFVRDIGWMRAGAGKRELWINFNDSDSIILAQDEGLVFVEKLRGMTTVEMTLPDYKSPSVDPE